MSENIKHNEFPTVADSRPRKGAWAPGGYMGKCVHCEAFFIGDKRAMSCAPCAYGDRAIAAAEGKDV